MTRYILIESNSGYIWADTVDFGVGRHERPEQAARRIDKVLDARHADEHSYILYNGNTSGRDGYYIYRAPNSFRTDYGGQDQDVIEAVERDCAYAGFVAVEPVQEDAK
jgi:hypothetical protein